MFFAKVCFRPENDQWWENHPEVRWLKNASIPQNQAIWMGSGSPPPGPYEIQNRLPAEKIKQWIEDNNCFPLAPILRNSLRYKLLCGGNGESDWCNFIFGTVRGKRTICGYCGHLVERSQGDWQCLNGEVPLTSKEVLNGQRIQSKLRFSWAYRVGNEWEIRIWGWFPYKGSHQNVPDLLGDLHKWMQKSPLRIESPVGSTSVELAKTSFNWWQLDQEAPADSLNRLRDG